MLRCRVFRARADCVGWDCDSLASSMYRVLRISAKPSVVLWGSIQGVSESSRVRKRLGDMDLRRSLFLWPAFLAPSLLGRLFSRSANWSGSFWRNLVRGSSSRGSKQEGIVVTWPPCAVHSVLLNEQLIAEESCGSKSLYISFLRGFRDAICSFVLLFPGFELDTVSTSEIISTDSVDFSFQLARLFCGEPVAARIVGVGWAWSILRRAVLTFCRVFPSPRSLCFRVDSSPLSPRGFTADIVLWATGAATAAAAYNP